VSALIEASEMRAYRTLDAGLCIDVMKSMWDDISEDGVESYAPDVINEFWVEILLDETLGLYRIHQLTSVCYQIHAFILPEHRDHAKESGRVILQWCLDYLTFNKLIAEIPKKYENVYHFTKNQGFKDEGVNRQSFLKDGKLWDTWRLGILKEEIWPQQ